MCSFVRWLPRQSQILREAEAERVTLRRMEDGQQMGTNAAELEALRETVPSRTDSRALFI